jgi:hypothetical protein
MTGESKMGAFSCAGDCPDATAAYEGAVEVDDDEGELSIVEDEIAAAAAAAAAIAREVAAEFKPFELGGYGDPIDELPTKLFGLYPKLEAAAEFGAYEDPPVLYRCDDG